MPLFERLETLEKASSIRDVMRLLEVLTRHAPHAATAPVRFAKASEQEEGRDDLGPLRHHALRENGAHCLEPQRLARQEAEETMPNQTYKVVELVGAL